MIGLPIGLVFAGYSLASWGFVLVKGYNITFREWFTPLHPWSGALDKNGTVPAGSLWPTSGKGTEAGTAPVNPVQGQQHQNLSGGAPNPHGFVQ